jgi:hypothetical protein
MVACLLLLALVDGATSRYEVSPVQKVIQLLGDLKAKVSAELAAEETMMAEFSQFCDDQANEKEDAITSAKRTINDLAATMEDASGTISSLQAEVAELGQQAAGTDRDLEAATAIRKKEHDDFLVTEKEMSEAVDTLERAIVVLKRGQTSFLQKGGGSTKDLRLLVASLAKVVSAAWVTSRQRSVVQNLLQNQAAADDEDLSLQPQATVAAYESKGGGIIETLEEMQNKAEQALSDARKTEMQAQHAFEMLKQSLTTELSAMEKRLGEAKSTQMEATEELHSAEGEKSSTEKGLANDESFLKELHLSCEAKSAEWEQRQKSAGEEMAAIDKAVEILKAGQKAFLQYSKEDPLGGAEESPEAFKRTQLVNMLTGLARSTKVFSLQQLAIAAADDPFAKVKTMLQSLIDRLLNEAAEEAEGKSFCEEEMAKTRAKQKELSAKIDRHAVRIEKAAAKKAILAQQVTELQAEVAKLDANQAEATKLRQEEKAAFEKSSEEYKVAASSIADAMQVLQQYYASGAFVQVGQPTMDGPSFGGDKGDAASTILGLLEVAESDFTKLLSEAEAEETAAAKAAESLTQENAVSKAEKTAEANAKSGEIKTLEVQLLNSKEDHSYVSKEMDAVMDYLDKLKPQCETKVMSYSERKSRREQEIAGLKEALALLE